VIVLAHDVEIDDEARASVASRLTAVPQELEDTVGHRGIPSKGTGFRRAKDMGFVGWRCSSRARAMETRTQAS
jgi:hypothetical protein